MRSPSPPSPSEALRTRERERPLKYVPKRDVFELQIDLDAENVSFGDVFGVVRRFQLHDAVADGVVVNRSGPNAA